VSYSKIGQTTEALADLNNAIKLNEDYVKAYVKKAEILMV